MEISGLTSPCNELVADQRIKLRNHEGRRRKAQESGQLSNVTGPATYCIHSRQLYWPLQRTLALLRLSTSGTSGELLPF